jgi:phospholipase C
MAKLLFQHVVVLILENRTFNYLSGYLGIGEGLTGVDATNYRKPNDKKTTAFKARRGGDYTAIGQGPSHSLKETNLQLFAKTSLPASGLARGTQMMGA